MHVYQIVESDFNIGAGTFNTTIEPVYVDLQRATYEMALLEERNTDKDVSYFIDTLTVNTEGL